MLEEDPKKIIHEQNSIFPLIFELLRKNPRLESIIPLPLQLNLIVDANPIIENLIWLTKERKKENALTRFLEVLQTKTVVAIAPTYLADEIKRKIPVISRERNIPENRLYKAWNEFKKYINFIKHKDLHKLNELCKRDPKDIPYMSLHFEYGYPIYTEDKDIPGMDGIVINAEVISNCRDYTRDANVEYTIKIAGLSGIIITSEIIKSFFLLISKIPKKILGFTAIIIILLLIIKPSREYILSMLEKAKENIPKIIFNFIEAIEPIAQTYTESKNNVEEKKKLLITHFSQTPKHRFDMLN